MIDTEPKEPLLDRIINIGGTALALTAVVWFAAPAFDENPVTTGIPGMHQAAQASELISSGMDHLPGPLDRLADLPRMDEPSVDPITPWIGSPSVQQQVGGQPLEPADS